MYTFICTDSIDGIFSGVYDAWASRYGHSKVSLTVREPENYMLFEEFIYVPVNQEKSRKVADTIRKRMGEEVYYGICQAVCAQEPETFRRSPVRNKADAVYRTIVLGLSLRDGSRVLEYLGESYVNQVFCLSRSTENEAHHLLGFLRFQELISGILFARIHPKNDVLPLLADHFSDRFPEENFMIFDENRKTAALHKMGDSFLITSTDGLDEAMLQRLSSDELDYQRLWCGFFESITIEARKNSRLQNHNMPKRFQKDTPEFGQHWI